MAHAQRTATSGMNVGIAIPVVPRISCRPPSGSDSDTDTPMGGALAAEPARVPSVAANSNNNNGAGQSTGARVARESTRTNESTPAPHRVRRRVRATGLRDRLQSTHTQRVRIAAPALPVPVYNYLPGAAPLAGKKRSRSASVVSQKKAGFVKAVHAVSDVAATAAAVLASRFLATHKGVVYPASSPSASTRAIPASVHLGEGRRQLVVCIAKRSCEGRNAVVEAFLRTVSRAIAPHAPAYSKDADTTGAPVLCMRVPTAALSAVILAAGTPSADGSTLSLSFKGPAAAALAATATRLNAVAAAVRRVLGAPWSWPVLMTRTADGSTKARFLAVDSYADVHASLDGAPLDLVHHRSAEALFKRMPDVLMTTLPGSSCRYVRLATKAPGASTTGAPGWCAKEQPLPEVEAVPAPKVPFTDDLLVRPPKRQRRGTTAPSAEVREDATPAPSVTQVNTGGTSFPTRTVKPEPTKLRAPSAPTPTPKAKVTPVATPKVKRVRFAAPPRAARTTRPQAVACPARPAAQGTHRAAPFKLLSGAPGRTAEEEQAWLLSAAAAELRAHGLGGSVPERVVLHMQATGRRGWHMNLVGLTANHWRSVDPWVRLGLSAASATMRTIRRRFRVLALRLHPDKNQSQESAAAFAAVAAAYDQIMAMMRSS